MPRPIRYVSVGRVTDVPDGAMKTVTVDERDVLLVHLDGQFFALDNQCPHQGAPLGRGHIEQRTVVCPRHAWRWDIKSGRAIWPDLGWRALSYPVRVEDDQILVRVP